MKMSLNLRDHIGNNLPAQYKKMMGHSLVFLEEGFTYSYSVLLLLVFVVYRATV